MLFLRMIECPSIHVIPVPTRPGAHGCTAAWGFGFQLSPEVVQWMGGGATIRDLAEVKKIKKRGGMLALCTWYGCIFYKDGNIRV